MVVAKPLRFDTEARIALVAWRVVNEKSQQWVADQLEVSQAAVSMWETGRYRPDPPQRDKLKDLCGIDPETWLTAEELRSVLRSLRRLAANA